MKYYSELNEALRGLYKMIDKAEDNPKNVLTVSNYLRNFLRIKVPNNVLPTTEVVTIIKHELPVVSSLIRKQKAGVLGIIIDLEMDYEQAKKNLNNIMKH